LDPYYQVPNDKALKRIINEAYLYSKNLLCEILEKSALTVSLTCDLWTARSRQGYLEKECLKDTHKYLRTIQDVETRWNSSYLSWKHLLKLKDRDPQTQKDSRRLNKIMLNDDEWTVLEKLVKLMEINTEELVDLTNEDTALDDIRFVDDYEEDW
ncbi:21564_t:CDS:2, partial [Gigaspora rosea]